MFNNKKINYLSLFLLFCVASSKGIIIYNEEILVALSFALFVVFSLSYFGSTIKDSLDERSSTIKFGSADFHRLKEESLQQLLSLHIQRKAAKKVFPFLKNDTENQLLMTTSSGSKASELSNRFCDQVQQKLNSFGSSKAELQQYLQKSIADTSLVFVICKKRNDKGNKNSVSISKQVQNSKQSFLNQNS